MTLKLVLIANLDPGVAAQVLELLPADAQPEILHRVARLGPITPEAVETLKLMLAILRDAVWNPLRRARVRQAG